MKSFRSFRDDSFFGQINNTDTLTDEHCLQWRKYMGLENEFGGRFETVVGLRSRPLRGQAGVRRHGQW